jgi:hypothetical protein
VVLEPGSDGDSLTVHGDGYEQAYRRAADTG